MEEAAAYFNIGEKRLKEMTDEPNSPHVLFCGNKRLIKKEKIQTYLDTLYSI